MKSERKAKKDKADGETKGKRPRETTAAFSLGVRFSKLVHLVVKRCCMIGDKVTVLHHWHFKQVETACTSIYDLLEWH